MAFEWTTVFASKKKPHVEPERKELIKVNSVQESYADQDRIFAEAVEASFVSEMEQAKRGEWNLSRSRFQGGYLEQEVRGRDSDDANRARQLIETNNGILDSQFLQEKQMVERGEWKDRSSILYVPGFRSAEVNELNHQKNYRFQQLAALQIERERAQSEQEKRELLETFSTNFNTEKAQIEAGQWDAASSSFRKDLFYGSVAELLVQSQSMLRELVEYESKIISDKERVRVRGEYEKERALAEKGEWAREQSYFFTIKKSSQFQKFDDALREDVQHKLADLGIFNMMGKGAGRNTGGPGGNGGQEQNTSQEDQARRILGLDQEVTYENARKAYRKFMMASHPDRNPNGVSEDAAKQIRVLTQVWPILEESLKRKEGIM